jgi:hypothetical protein
MSTPRKPRSWHYDRVVTVPLRAAAEVVDQYFFTANGRAYEVISVDYVGTVAGSDGSAVTGDITVCSSGEAPSEGATVLGATKIDFKGTAETVQSPALAAAVTVADGESLALNVTGTATAVAGAAITVILRPADLTAFA